MFKILCFLLPYWLFALKTDLIIFSYDRPMQLYALLKSVSLNVSHIHQTFILYRTSDSEIACAYEELESAFPKIQFVKQGENPQNDFKPLLLKCFRATSAEYILFAVDDDIVKEPVDLSECIHALEMSNAYCFFLRLGENVTRQYQNPDVPLFPPPSTNVQGNILKYYLNDGCGGDWRYPNNLDMTLYKKERIASFFFTASYSSPNTLESEWAARQTLSDYGLYFKTSKIFSTPINVVQTDFLNPHEGTFSAKELFELWKEGYEFDLTPYLSFNNSSAFVTLKPTFLKRGELGDKLRSIEVGELNPSARIPTTDRIE
jgi:hypothetical protein